MNVLTGNETAMNGIGSGKVLKSGPNDHVFIFFSDHGAPNLIGFPQGRVRFYACVFKTSYWKELLRATESIYVINGVRIAPISSNSYTQSK